MDPNCRPEGAEPMRTVPRRDNGGDRVYRSGSYRRPARSGTKRWPGRAIGCARDWCPDPNAAGSTLARAPSSCVRSCSRVGGPTIAGWARVDSEPCALCTCGQVIADSAPSTSISAKGRVAAGWPRQFILLALIRHRMFTSARCRVGELDHVAAFRLRKRLLRRNPRG